MTNHWLDVDHHRLGLLGLCGQLRDDCGEHADPDPPLLAIVKRL